MAKHIEILRLDTESGFSKVKFIDDDGTEHVTTITIPIPPQARPINADYVYAFLIKHWPKTDFDKLRASKGKPFLGVSSLVGVGKDVTQMYLDIQKLGE